MVPFEIRALDNITAKWWIKNIGGENVYNAIWGPLLEGKFADYNDKIPALWLWGRIYDRSLKLGYINGSAKTLFDKLIGEIESLNGEIVLEAEVSGVESKGERVEVTVGRRKTVFDKCLLTTVSPISAQLIKNKLDDELIKNMNANDHLGAVCVILELKESVQSQYWLNICEKGADVLVMVEHTNLIDRSHYANRHIVYLANYIHRSKKRFQMTEKEVIDEYTSFLKTINPSFKKSWVLKAHLARIARTQTIFYTGALKTRPPHRLPVKNLYMANIDQMYPHDRNLNLGVMLGKRVSRMMIEDQES
jgi:protoporphyrinogen oxidase